jgi:hypothetical protein
MHRILIILDLDDHIYVSVGRLCELEQSNTIDSNNPKVAVEEDKHDYNINRDEDDALDPEEAEHVEGLHYYSKRDDMHYNKFEDAQVPYFYCNRDDLYDLATKKRRVKVSQ